MTKHVTCDRVIRIVWLALALCAVRVLERFPDRAFHGPVDVRLCGEGLFYECRPVQIQIERDR